MHLLTIFNKARQEVKKLETFEPPDPKIIESELRAAGPGAWYDVARKELEPEDFDYREEAD